MEELNSLPGESQESYLGRYRIYLRQLRYEAELATLVARNAHRQHLRALSRNPSHPEVVALGRVAQEKARAAGIAKGRVDIAEAVLSARTRGTERGTR